MAKKRNNKPHFVPSRGTVFADLGLTNTDEKQTKAQFAVMITRIIEAQRVSQSATARRLKINQPKISALANYPLEGFSVERLMHFLNALDRGIEIEVRPRPRSRKGARILVTAA